MEKSARLPAAVSKALEELKQALSELYGARLRGLYLYGSYARGDFEKDSDVDLLIALGGEVDTYQEMDRMSEVVADICLRHDVLIATYPVPESWLKTRLSPLFENIRREGVLV